MKYISGLTVAALTPLCVLTTALADAKAVQPRNGADVATDLNTRYASQATQCPGSTPRYNCMGVTLRGTVNDDFDPWEPSPNALRKGSQSFSFIAATLRITALYRNSGFILSSPDIWTDQNEKPEYLCSFPHDAWTDQLGRPSKGCAPLSPASQPLLELLLQKPELKRLIKDNEALAEKMRTGEPISQLRSIEPALAEFATSDLTTLQDEMIKDRKRIEGWKTAEPSSELSSCDVEIQENQWKWLDYAKTLTHPSQQCSFSTQNPFYFELSNIARQETSIAPGVYSTYNEVLLSTWKSGTAATLPLEAFFYQNAAGLPEAKVYQQKYAQRTGGLWLPVIKLELPSSDWKPFSYNSADQAIQP